VVIALVAVLAGGVQQSAALSASVVISQVYGGGGNTGATFKNDFIELFNRGSAPVSVDGWSVQYASATGSTWQVTPLSGTIAPGRYYLVQEAAGAGGTVDLPTPDATGSIFMSATNGKVALVSSTTPLTGTCPLGGSVIDFVGYMPTLDPPLAGTCFEGSAPAPALTNTTADLRDENGCAETDDNAADFSQGSPNPRNSVSPAHFCTGENAPTVAATDPAAGATGVARDANITITFSEPVSVSDGWYGIACAGSGSHTAVVTGGPTTYVLNPDADFAAGETCTVTVFGSRVSDQDLLDPPDNPTGDHSFSFTTDPEPSQIAQVQGAGHLSPFVGQLVKVEGVVIAERGSNTWIQDATPDADPATSEALLVFGSTVSNAVAVRDHVEVSGTVTEFRPGGSAGLNNLTITELASPGLGVTKLSSGNPLPAATVIGAGGRVPPTAVIENDSSTGNVETNNTFDHALDGIDFYETLESMLVQVNNPVAVGPRNQFGEILVLADNGAGSSARTTRGGIVIRDVDPATVGDYRNGDFNPERIMLDDLLVGSAGIPNVDVADGFTTSAVGVMTYDFANYKIAVTSALTAVDRGLAKETTDAPIDQEIAVATFNVENLSPESEPEKFAELAGIIVNSLRAPDIISVEEVQDNSGPADDGVTDATQTWSMLVAAIQAAGGPAYQYRQIDPVNNQDGGVPGANIRVGFLFRTDRGVEFVDRPGGGPMTANVVDTAPNGTPQLRYSPGRVDPANPAWSTPEGVRKPLAAEFKARGKRLFVIANHWKSKNGDQPLFGRFQPPIRGTEPQRNAEAQVVRDFVDDILAVDANANVIVLGDLNDFEFSAALTILEGGGTMNTLIETLPQAERYSYVFEGNSQTLDHIVVSDNLRHYFAFEYDSVHVNAEFFAQASDHDPQVARFDLHGPRAPK
jgi:predicted extracellular nuclease